MLFHIYFSKLPEMGIKYVMKVIELLQQIPFSYLYTNFMDYYQSFTLNENLKSETCKSIWN